MLRWPQNLWRRLSPFLPWPSLRVWQRRLAHGGHALVGFAGLCLSACGADTQQRDLNLKLDPISLGQPLTTPPQKPVTHVFVLGDSISSGMGAESLPLSYASLLYRNQDALYPEDRGQDLVHHFGRNLHYINVAHHGDTTYDVLANQLPALSARLEKEAKRDGSGVIEANGTWQIPGRVVVVMTVGGNDVQDALQPRPNFTGRVLANSLSNMGTIFEFLEDEAHFPGGIATYFGNVYDVTDGEDQLNSCMAGMAFPGMASALEVWSASYGDLAAEHKNSRLVDALGLFRGHGFNFANPHNPYFKPHDTTLWVYDRDCIHPNNLGHNMLRRAFFEHISDDFPAGEAALAY